MTLRKKYMKETAVTADLAKKAMENNMNIEESSRLLGFARTHIRDAMRICNEVGFAFENLVSEVRNKDQLISAWCKYRTRNGDKVRLLCVDGPGEQPVVGFVDGDDGVHSWDAFGKFMRMEESGLDLLLDEGKP